MYGRSSPSRAPLIVPSLVSYTSSNVPKLIPHLHIASTLSFPSEKIQSISMPFLLLQASASTTEYWSALRQVNSALGPPKVAVRPRSSKGNPLKSMNAQTLSLRPPTVKISTVPARTVSYPAASRHINSSITTIARSSLRSSKLAHLKATPIQSAGSGSGSGSDSQLPKKFRYFTTNGKNIVDSNGHVVRLTGVNWYVARLAIYM